MQDRIKTYGLLAVALLPLIGIWFAPPIAQDTTYHTFADRRWLFDIPNFFNVISNLPFVLVGVLGLSYLLRRRAAAVPGCLNPLYPHYLLFFGGVLLTGFGSSYYHWAPSNHTLVWDRLPMTLSFMAFFCVLLGEQLSLRWARRLLVPLLALGIASVVYWHWSEARGRGDLRPYLLVQFAPMLVIPYLLLGYKSPFTSNKNIWLVIACYLAAKLAEHFDHGINLAGISGHTLKHLLAALGTYYFLQALKQRRALCDK